MFYSATTLKEREKRGSGEKRKWDSKEMFRKMLGQIIADEKGDFLCVKKK